jgi:DNA-binding MarR family transcriptional regulator
MTHSDLRQDFAGLLSEVKRVSARLNTIFADTRRAAGLSESELLVLTAVIDAERPPTAPQIGRSFGYPRQLIQRAANALIAQGLIETAPNPDHKRAVLLKVTAQGMAVKRRSDVKTEEIAAELAASLDLEVVRNATALLHALRRQLEAHIREHNT